MVKVESYVALNKYIYSETSEQRTRWGQYKFTCFVPLGGSNCIATIGKQNCRVIDALESFCEYSSCV